MVRFCVFFGRFGTFLARNQGSFALAWGWLAVIGGQQMQLADRPELRSERTVGRERTRALLAALKATEGGNPGT